MRLVLVRHGEAEPLRMRDSERVLTARGHEQAVATGAWLGSRLSGRHGEVCHHLPQPPFRTHVADFGQGGGDRVGWKMLDNFGEDRHVEGL